MALIVDETKAQYAQADLSAAASTHIDRYMLVHYETPAALVAGAIFSFDKTAQVYQRFSRIAVTAGGALEFQWNDGSSKAAVGPALEPLTKYVILIGLASTGVKIWLDGVIVGSGAGYVTNTDFAFDRAHISGGIYNSSNAVDNYLTGKISYAYLLNNALTEQEEIDISSGATDPKTLADSKVYVGWDLVDDIAARAGGVNAPMTLYPAGADAPTFDGLDMYGPSATPGIPSNTLEYQGAPVTATTATISVHAGTDLKATSDFRVTGVALTSGVFSAIDLSGTTIAVGDPIVIEALPSEGSGIILRTTAGDIA